MFWKSASLCIFLAASVAANAQAPSAPAPATVPSPAQVQAPAQSQAQVATEIKGGTLHGTVKAGSVSLPGVGVTAKNTLTGKQYTTVTDINGNYTLVIPANGRYVLRTDLAGFVSLTKESLLNTTSSHDQTVSFDLTLASRAEKQAQAEETRAATSQKSGKGAQSLSLAGLLNGNTELAGGNTSEATSALPSAVQGNDFGSGTDSVAINGQAGTMNPMASLDMDQLRNAFELMHAQDNPGGPDGGGGPGGPGGGPGGPGGPGGGGRFGGGGGRGGGFGGGRGNFRNFKANQAHGGVYWNGNNSALNAQPYSFSQNAATTAPAYGSNQFGGTIMGEPEIPGLFKPTGKDTVFLNVNVTRSSSPSTFTATVPTLAERQGIFTGVTLYNPYNNGQVITGNVPISSLAQQLLTYIPTPTNSNTTQNYYRVTTSQSNTTVVGARYIHSFGPKPPAGTNLPGFLTQFLMSGQQKFRQSVNANFNYSKSASDSVNLVPILGGKTSSENYSLQLGYSLGYKKLNNNFSVAWNRSTPETTNYFTNREDIATSLGILGPNGNPLTISPFNWGLPSISISGGITGLSNTQPSTSTRQTISATEGLGWIYGKHNLRFGGNLRFVQNNTIGGGGTTGALTFTGCLTAVPNLNTAANIATCEAAGTPTSTSGNAIADFLLAAPQNSTISALYNKEYMRQHTWDLYAMDDWRILPHLTLNYGVRYEFFSPFSEKNGHLSTIDYNANFISLVEVESGQTGQSGTNLGRLPNTLVFPFHTAIAPRVGYAWRITKGTVFRGGYGINYNTGQYATIGNVLAHQPPFSNIQKNDVTRGVILTPVSNNVNQQNGFFPAPESLGNYAVNPHYFMPYVQAWNLDLQQNLRWNIQLNVGYNGSRGTHLDVTSAPSYNTASQVFNFENSEAFSIYHGLTVRLRKRLQKGVSMGATYVYSHSIDDAGSVGGSSTIVAQNWQNMRAEEGNSSFDQRHRISGDYLFELPFGPDKYWLNSGNWFSHAVSGLSFSGNFTFATGTMLTPTYANSSVSVARGTAGSERPDRVPGVSVTAGAHSAKEWFNPNAFTTPAITPSNPFAYGDASRNSIVGPGTVQNNMSISRTQSFGGTRSMEVRTNLNNVFNTVQYSSVNTDISSQNAGQVTHAGTMRTFSFTARYRF